MFEVIDRRIRKLVRTMVRLPARAVVKTLETSLKVQKLQLVVLGGESKAGAELFQHYGFTSAPLEDCEAVAVPIGGRSNHIIVVATEDRRYRPVTLNRGEVAIYTKEGDILHFKEGREVELKAGKLMAAIQNDATIQAGATATLKGGTDAVVEGGTAVRLGAAGANLRLITELFMVLFNSHVHSGVTTGPGNSGPPTTPLGTSHMTGKVRVTAL